MARKKAPRRAGKTRRPKATRAPKKRSKKALERERRRIEAKWWRGMRVRGWRSRHGMLYKPSLVKKGKFNQQHREEEREVARLKRLLKDAGADVWLARGRFTIW